jgi:predicted nucleic acid-binding protein
MQAVSDTSPLFNLAAIDRLPLLFRQFQPLLVPPEVIGELEPVAATGAGMAIHRAVEHGWVLAKEVVDRSLLRSLQLRLDLGEAAAIALALQWRVPTVLMDEKEGRRAARDLGLRPVGVLGILLRAKRDGDLPSVKEAIVALRAQAGFFIAPELFRQVLTMAGEI